MGSIARVNVSMWIKLLCFKSKLPVLVHMDGLNIYKTTLPQRIIIMGNEANGISEDLEKLIKIDSQFLVLVIFKKQKV
jgi:TrmH family RNA methyltransferase